MKRFTFGLMLAVSFLFFACEKDPPPIPPTDTLNGTFEFNLTATAAGETFLMETPYEYEQNKRYKVSDFRMYVSNIRLIKPDSSELLISETQLFNLMTNHKPAKTSHLQGEYFTTKVPKGKYIGVKFGVGVPPERNNLNPTLYDPSHPLSNQQGLHWSWNTGYRFLVFEGETIVNDSSKSFAYHLGTNELYREYSYIGGNYEFEVVGTDRELQFIVELDINKLFGSGTTKIDPRVESISHTTGSGFNIASRLSDNIGKSMFVYTLLSPSRQ